MLQILLSRLSVRGVDEVIGSQRRNVSFFGLAGGNILVVLALMLLKNIEKREREREHREEIGTFVWTNGTEKTVDRFDCAAAARGRC